MLNKFREQGIQGIQGLKGLTGKKFIEFLDRILTALCDIIRKRG